MNCHFTVCVRFRVTVDADVNQHGPTSLHRRATLPVTSNAQESRRTYRVHLDDRVGRVHARSVLVPQADCSKRRQLEKYLHAGVSE